MDVLATMSSLPLRDNGPPERFERTNGVCYSLERDGKLPLEKKRFHNCC